MDTRDKQIELINRFLRGELTKTEERDFHRRLEEDDMFSKLHREQVLVIEGIRYAARKDLRQKLDSIESEIAQRERSQSPQTLFRRIAAGIVLVLAGLAVAYIFILQSDAPRLYETHFNPPENIEITRSRGSSNGQEAVRAYNEGNYERAEEEFEKAIDRQFDYQLLYYQAIIKMRLEKLDEATLLLNRVLEGDNNLHTEARWYLALAYIKINRSDEAIPLLQQVTSSDSPFKTEALNLLQELKAKA